MASLLVSISAWNATLDRLIASSPHETNVKEMNSDKPLIRLAGLLILLQLTAAIISHSVILEPILYGSSDFLPTVLREAILVRWAALLEFVVGASWFGASVLLFPILKLHSERIATWFVGIKLAEFVTLMIGAIIILTLLYTSQKHNTTTANEAANLSTLAAILRYARGATQNLSLLAYAIGSSLFFYLMITTRLIPRPLSILGLLGIAGLLTEVLMSIFGFSTASFMYIIMMPMGITEILLGIWLITRGIRVSPR